MTAPSCPLIWPDYKTLLAMRGTRWSNLGRHLNLGLAMLSTLALRPQVESALMEGVAGAVFLARDKRFFEPLYFHYVNTQHWARERFMLAAQDLLRVKSYLAVHGDAEQILFKTMDWSLGFGINRICREEGYWAFTLRNAMQQSVYSVSVACNDAGDLFVGSVQGCEAGVEDPKEAIRLLTRQMEGLRPPHFLIEVLKSWCRATQSQCFGVSAACQVKAHRRSGASSQVFFDYDGFWQECGAAPAHQGYWLIPTAPRVRDLSAVPSKKRAMYRRREDMLQALTIAIDAAAQRLKPFAQGRAAPECWRQA